MPKPYSIDLRERVTAAISAGESFRAVAKRFRVSLSSAQRFMTLQRQSGSVKGKAYGGRRTFLLEPHKELIAKWVAQQPDITQLEIRERLQEQGSRASQTAVRNLLLHMGLSYKKNRVRR